MTYIPVHYFQDVIPHMAFLTLCSPGLIVPHNGDEMSIPQVTVHS